LIACDGVRDYLCDDFEAREVFLHLKIGVTRKCSADAGSKLPIHMTDGGRGRLGLNSETQGLQLQLRINIDFPRENGGNAFYLAAVLLEGDALQGRRGKGRMRRGEAYEINEQRCDVEQGYTCRILTQTKQCLQSAIQKEPHK
jgi:hypothetical protein